MYRLLSANNKGETELEKTTAQTQLQKKLDEQVSTKIDQKLEQSATIIKDFDIDNPHLVLDEIDKPVEIVVGEEYAYLFSENPIRKHDYLLKDDHNIESKDDFSLRIKENEFGKNLLKTKEFDLLDENVKIRDNAVNSLYLGETDKFKMFSAGKADVLDENSVYIEDVDVNNIPAHLDIVLDKTAKEIVIIGKEVDEEDGEGKKEGGDKERIDNEVFLEKTYKEMFDKAFNHFERMFMTLISPSLFRTLLKYAPLTVFVLFWLSTYHEERLCYKSVDFIERDKMKYLNKLKYGKDVDLAK